MRNVFVLCMMLLCLGIHAQEGVVTDGRFCGNAGDYVIYTRLTEPQIREFAFHRGRSLSGDHFEPIYLQGVRLLVPKEKRRALQKRMGKICRGCVCHRR